MVYVCDSLLSLVNILLLISDQIDDVVSGKEQMRNQNFYVTLESQYQVSDP
jgi:hypothetical protein